MTAPEVPAVDLDVDSREALELDALLAWVASHARTPTGRRRVLERRPLSDREQTCRDHDAVDEVRRHLHAAGRVVTEGFEEPGPALEVLEVAGLALEAKPLRELATAGMATSMLRARLAALPVEEHPWLRATAARLPELGPECGEPLRGIEADGRLNDSASSELRKIRVELGRAGSRLRTRLERIVRDPAAGGSIRDDFVTQRNGRFVVPVRADAQRRIRGIVHAASSSGATQFVEPLETVELNNELVRLAELEREEIERLLTGWTERLRARLPELHSALAALAAVDDAQARALFAEETSAIRPALGSCAALVLREARHPLLERRLQAGGPGCVPLDLELDPAEGVLVISGPNAGGKTVALKTLGLLVLMAQAGIPLPAKEARLPLFRQVRVDIGDHQSIQADLSTYSAHVGAVARFLEGASAPALFLFDEIGSGTEPAEGAALARAILESLAGRGITAVATTHLGAVKEWAAADERARSAAMEFDAERLRPTFRILMGMTGISAGLEIARRVGLPAKIVARARDHLGPAAVEREDRLARLQLLVREAESERDRLVDERRREREVRERTREREERERRAWRDEAARRIDRAVRAVERRGLKEISAITDARGRSRREKSWSRATGGIRAEGERLAGVTRVAPEDGAAVPERLLVGMEVRVVSIGKVGCVVEAVGERAKVRVGGMVIDARRRELRAVAGSAGPARPSQVGIGSRAAGAAGGGATEELVLVGLRVEEALRMLDRFLDSALLAGREQVRVVHGHGTGRLREAVRKFLREHAAVAAQRAGRDEEGGEAATIARLA